MFNWVPGPFEPANINTELVYYGTDIYDGRTVWPCLLSSSHWMVDVITEEFMFSNQDVGASKETNLLISGKIFLRTKQVKNMLIMPGLCILFLT